MQPHSQSRSQKRKRTIFPNDDEDGEMKEMEMVEESKEADDSMDESDDKSVTKKKRRLSKKKKAKKIKSHENSGESIVPMYPPTLDGGPGQSVSCAFLLDEIRATNNVESEAVALGALVSLHEPPINLVSNSISPRYNDSIAFTLVRIMAENDIQLPIMEPFRRNYDWLMKHIRDTIDPTIVNAMNRNLLFVVTDPKTYPKDNPNPRFTHDIKTILCEISGTDLWTTPDINGNVAVFNMQSKSNLSHLSQALFRSMTHFKKLIQMRDRLGNTILHLIFQDQPQWSATSHQPNSDLILMLLDKPNYFKHIDLTLANDKGETLFDCIDRAAAYHHQRWLSYPQSGWSPATWEENHTYYSVPKRIREMWLKVSTTAMQLHEELSKHIILDLSHIVTEYLFFFRPPSVLTLGFTIINRYYLRMEVPSDGTVGEFKRKVTARFYPEVTPQNRRGYDENMNATYVLMAAPGVEDHALMDNNRLLVDEGVKPYSLIKLKFPNSI